jgi:protocatechuate 3,4-dioxygenase beta subunit
MLPWTVLMEAIPMDNDDKQIGVILNRRDTLKILGITSAALLAGCAPGLLETFEPVVSPSPTPLVLVSETAVHVVSTATSTAIPACIVRPELSEGPFFVDQMLHRVDLRTDPMDGSVKEGVPLRLAFNVTRISSDGCRPLQGAQVDVWHCDAVGVYSGVQDPAPDISESKFLRGYQLSDANGAAHFLTIYPGWYPGRTVHIHFKIRVEGYDFTSQLFFDDTLTDQIYKQEVYAQRGERSVRNEGDSIYPDAGEQLLLKARPDDDGYAATFDIGLQI